MQASWVIQETSFPDSLREDTRFGKEALIFSVSSKNPIFMVDASTVVLELGCGHGLPGCLLLRKGAKVYFQDLNEDTLTKATIPTIVVNCGVEAISRCTLLCGDWAHVPVLMKDVKVDIILASDTIYTPETIRSFVTAVNELANPETLVWIASQKYYFGLGGGTQALISIIKEMQLPLEVECLKTVEWRSAETRHSSYQKVSLPCLEQTNHSK